MTKQPESMSRAELQRAMDRAGKASMELCDEMIAAGRGNERPSETAGKTDPLSVRFNAARALDSALHAEAARRMRYHGNLLPIKR